MILLEYYWSGRGGEQESDIDNDLLRVIVRLT